ncbi:hypothetical protein ACGFIK_05145 [Micromonospora sp. NPDC048871]|uniref:hypothetical protein n=1 Tax=unclassified Micromonospora TaxID=2617518 RepID=UPI002E0EF6FF|nr:hypothetical protein OIE53_05240 [Micromonospora sp. NBC_01739]
MFVPYAPVTKVDVIQVTFGRRLLAPDSPLFASKPLRGGRAGRRLRAGPGAGAPGTGRRAGLVALAASVLPARRALRRPVVEALADL